MLQYTETKYVAPEFLTRYGLESYTLGSDEAKVRFPGSGVAGVFADHVDLVLSVAGALVVGGVFSDPVDVFSSVTCALVVAGVFSDPVDLFLSVAGALGDRGRFLGSC